MTYPPGGPGYQQPPQPHFSAPTQQFERIPEPAASAPASSAPSVAPSAPAESRLPSYLSIAVAVLGFAIYLTSFGPVFGEFGGSAFELVVAPVVAGLLAGIGLLPKQTDRSAIAAVLAVLGFLLLILVVVAGAAIDWAFYPFIVFSVLQSFAAVGVVLLDSGVITAPAPRPKYEQPHPYGAGYGAPGGYYGQPPVGGPQQPGYPPQQYGGYQGPGAPNSGGFPALGRPNTPQAPQPGPFGGAVGGQAAQTTAWPTAGIAAGAQGGQQNGPPTPPTGFPAFGQPQAQADAGAAPTAAQDDTENSDAQATQVVAPQQSAPPPS